MAAFESAKKYIGILTLFTAVATGHTAFAQVPGQLPGGEAEMPDAASAEQIQNACEAIADWMTDDPAMAAIIKGFPNHPRYQPSFVKNAIEAACHFTPEQWAKMPDVKKVDPAKLDDGHYKVCNMLRGLVDGGGIGILGVFGGKQKGDLIAGEAVLHYACNLPERAAPAVPQKQESPTFVFPPNPVPATPEMIAEACGKIEKGISTHPGAALLFKGTTGTNYDPSVLAETAKESCPNLAEKIAAAPSPETLLNGLNAKRQPGSSPLTLPRSAEIACADLGKKIESRPEFNEIFRKNEKAFMYACTGGEKPAPKGP